MKRLTSARLIMTGWATLLWLVALPARGQHIAWTAESLIAHQQISGLRLTEGQATLQKHRASQPGNHIWTYLEDYAEFLSIFTQEDLRRIPAYLRASSTRLDKLAALPETQPLNLMAQAQIHLHHCALRLQQSQFINAGTDINKAFKLLKRNQKLHPDDVANLRLLASLKVAFGAIPDQYRWLVAMLTSLTGTIEEGLGELHGILRTTRPETNPFFAETVLYTALAEGRLNNQPAAGWRLLTRHFGEQPPTRSVQFMMAQLLMASGQNDNAIRVLTATPPGIQIPFMDFMMAQCKLYRGDRDAESYFKRFLQGHKGKHFIKEAHQKLAWAALLREDRPGYVYHMQQVLIRGSATTDEDKQALQEAEYHRTPHPVLLRARLSFDGGYYQRGLDGLSDAFYNTLNQHVHRLEFLYRKGRCLQALEQHAEALHYFHLAINAGRYDRYYFACSSALQCGIIHEGLGNRREAASYYQMCLEMDPDTYNSSLHQQARTGLNRIGQ